MQMHITAETMYEEPMCEELEGALVQAGMDPDGSSFDEGGLEDVLRVQEFTDH